MHWGGTFGEKHWGETFHALLVVIVSLLASRAGGRDAGHWLVELERHEGLGRPVDAVGGRRDAGAAFPAKFASSKSLKSTREVRLVAVQGDACP